MTRDVGAGPREVRVSAGGAVLALRWPGDAAATVAAATLRAACRCAGCAAARETGGSGPVAADVAIVSIEPIGGYAVNIGFSDGHARGVYPWALLRELSGI